MEGGKEDLSSSQLKNIALTAAKLIQNFNPVLYSIDTYIIEFVERDEKLELNGKALLIQILNSWEKEKAVIEIFITNFYTDRAGCILRKDISLFSALAAITLYLIDTITFEVYRLIINSQDSVKMHYFCSYIFDSNTLLSCLRSEWMKVRDLDYIENVLIANLEAHESQARHLCEDLARKAVGQQINSSSSSFSSPKKSSSGLPSLVKSKLQLTRPVSPKISKPHPRPVMPLIEENSETFESPPKIQPSMQTTLSELEIKAQKRREEAKKSVEGKYDEKDLFHFNTSLKAADKMESLQRELEDNEANTLAFNATYVNPIPDFERMPALVRVNAAAILREDALYRKQQAKDAALLRSYESELRDANEYYTWQQNMRDADAKTALYLVEQRRDQAKQSSEEARVAILKAKEENKAVADLLREEAKAIKIQKEMEDEIIVLRKREVAQGVQDDRGLPRVALEKIQQEKVEAARRQRLELEEVRKAKEAQEKIEEAERADRTRRQKAVNSVHKQHVVVFDPTDVAGEVFLDQMSYLEMKERLAMEKSRADAIEAERRSLIVTEKQKKTLELEEKARSIQRARSVKSSANAAVREKQRSQEIQEAERLRTLQIDSDSRLQKILAAKRLQREEERRTLEAEQERAKQVIQFAGASVQMLAATRVKQLSLARERQARTLQEVARSRNKLEATVEKKELMNKSKLLRLEKDTKIAKLMTEERSKIKERQECTERMREDIIRKKALNVIGQYQHHRTKDTLERTNPYASRVSKSDIEYGRSATKAFSSTHMITSTSPASAFIDE